MPYVFRSIFLVPFLLHTALSHIFLYAFMPLVFFPNHIFVILVAEFGFMLVKISNDNVLMSTFSFATTSHTLLCLYILLFPITWNLRHNWKYDVSYDIAMYRVFNHFIFKVICYSEHSNSYNKPSFQNNIFKQIELFMFVMNNFTWQKVNLLWE